MSEQSQTVQVTTVETVGTTQLQNKREQVTITLTLAELETLLRRIVREI